MEVSNVRNSSISHGLFSDILAKLDNNDFLVVNNTRVRNARLHAKKVTGGVSEIFITDVVDSNKCFGLVRGKFKPGDIVIGEGYPFKLISRDNDGVWEMACDSDINKIMENHGHIPLPPYIARADSEQDKKDYQTVYAKETGSSAAPTAGLHFTDDLLSSLKNNGVEVLELTLDVGLGTFRPVKTEYMDDHIMHRERYFISEETADKINDLKSKGKRLTAVGSTSVRALETASNDKGIICSGESYSEIFIKPPYKFKAVDNMITNFHLQTNCTLFLGYFQRMDGHYVCCC